MQEEDNYKSSSNKLQKLEFRNQANKYNLSSNNKHTLSKISQCNSKNKTNQCNNNLEVNKIGTKAKLQADQELNNNMRVCLVVNKCQDLISTLERVRRRLSQVQAQVVTVNLMEMMMAETIRCQELVKERLELLILIIFGKSLTISRKALNEKFF
jgi:hypothetical protein